MYIHGERESRYNHGDYVESITSPEWRGWVDNFETGLIFVAWTNAEPSWVSEDRVRKIDR